MLLCKPLVSIVVPVFNAEKYLAKCIESVLKQTYETLEVILIDDGSKDGSAVICDQYALFDERIIVFHIKNSGVSNARNLGIQKATGKYICFIDSDDVIDKEYVEKLVVPYLQYPIELSICGILEEIVWKNIKRVRRPKAKLTGSFCSDYYALIEFLRVPFSKLYMLNIIKDNKIRFPQNISYAEDQVFNFQYYYYVKEYSFIDEPLYTYIHRRDTLSDLRNVCTQEKFNQYLFKLEKEKRFLEDNVIKNRDIIFNDHVIPAVTRFASLESYTVFKNNVNQVKDLIYSKNTHSSFRKKLFWLLFVSNFLFPIYVYLKVRRFVELRLSN